MATTVKLLRGGTIATDYGVIKGSLLVVGDKIGGIFEESIPDLARDVQVVDVAGCVIVPGAIDTHVHFNESNVVEREGYLWGSRAAAAGGVTTVLEEPQGDPTVVTRETLDQKKDIAGKKSIVDFGLWAAAVPDNFNELEPMVQGGAIGIKAFTVTPRPTFPRLNDWEMLRVFRLASRLGKVVQVHCESDSIVTGSWDELKAQGRKDVQAITEWRPSIAEIEAVQRVIQLAGDARAKVHIAHVSTPGAASKVKEARLRGQDVSMETVLQYLVMSQDDVARLGPYAKCLPPLRKAAEASALWDYVLDPGVGCCLASDHAAATIEEKELGWQDIWKAPNGVNLIQFTRPVFLEEAVISRGLPLQDFVRITSTNAARRFAIYPKKGTFLPGSDADVVVYHLDSPWTITEDSVAGRYKYTPLAGRACKVRVLRTMVRGEWVYNEGEFEVEPGHGRFVSPLESGLGFDRV